MAGGALACVAIIYLARRFLGLKLPEVITITIGKAKLERAAFHAKEIGYIEGFRDGTARIYRTDRHLTAEEAEEIKQRFVAAQKSSPKLCLAPEPYVIVGRPRPGEAKWSWVLGLTTALLIVAAIVCGAVEVLR